ncbi:MAG: TRAP transporter substrate-binding protein [Rhodospirillaceae bacterium]|nr:TRAP transporter substrate-binding protein [Rhodospirillaceae bacterium]
MIISKSQVAKLGIAGLIMSAVAVLPGAPASAQAVKMKLAGATVNDLNHAYLKEFKARIEKKTGGRIEAGVYPAGQLGGIQQMIEGLILGTQELYLVPPDFLVGLNSAFGSASAPGLFDDQAHAVRAILDKPFYSKFTNLAQSKGIVGISYYIYGPASYLTKKPIRTVADLKGLKIRVLASPVERGIVAALGATGVPVPYGEVPAALRQGVLDGARTAMGGPAAGGWYDIVPNVTITGGSYISILAMVSKRWLDKLPADLRKAVLETGAELNQWAIGYSRDWNSGAKEVWLKGGGKVIEMAPGQAELLRSKIAAVGGKVFDKEPAKSMYETLKASAARTRK